jgi:cytochrome c oxidase subunit 3
MSEATAEHFEDLQVQEHAARLGMWTFLASELLFFSAFFVLYTSYRTEHPGGFDVAVLHNTLALGSINTGVLLVSSYSVAMAVHQLRGGKNKASAWLIGATIFLGLCFLVIKAAEYAKHFGEGIYPGGVGHFYLEHGEPGTKMFFTLYYCATGLHALHVFVGMCVLTFLMIKVARRDLDQRAPYPLAIGAIYWHLVDLIWIFLWPLFYLTPGGAR